MVADYTIRRRRTSDATELIALYRTTFTSIDGPENIDAAVEKFLDLIQEGAVICAFSEDKLLGFAGYNYVSRIPSSTVVGKTMEEVINQELFYARYPEARTYLWQSLAEIYSKQNNGKIEIVSFENEFTVNNWQVNSNDTYCLSIGITPEFQGNGLGRILVGEGERLARESGSLTLYVHCKGSSGSQELFQRVGFKPILLAGPWFEDGTFIVMMGKRL